MNDNIPQDPRLSICPGCRTYIRVNQGRVDIQEDGYYDVPQCNVQPMTHGGKPCPCSQCVVKMVCEDTCEELEKYKDYCRYGDNIIRSLYDDDTYDSK